MCYTPCYTFVTPLLHTCYTFVTPLLNICHTPCYKFVTPLLNICNTRFTHLLHRLLRLRYTVVTLSLIITILMHSYSVVFVLWHFVQWRFVRDSISPAGLTSPLLVYFGTLTYVQWELHINCQNVKIFGQANGTLKIFKLLP